MIFFVFVQRPATLQEGGLSRLQDSVYLPSSSSLSAAVKEENSTNAAVIIKGWLEKNPPQGYEQQHTHIQITYTH